METTPRVSFLGMDASEALETRARGEIAALARRHRDLSRCDVTLTGPPKHRKHGGLYTVRIELAVPGREMVVNREPGRDHGREDPFVAVRDAFAAARRQLARTGDRAHRDVKMHEATKVAAVLERST